MKPAAPDAPDDPADKLTGGRLLARNAAGNLVSQCLPMAVALLTLPWQIRGLGTDRFGVLTLSWMVLGYFSLFDLGLGRALTVLVAERLGQGPVGERSIPGLVWTSCALMAALGAAGGLAVAILSPWLIVDVLKVPTPLRVESIGAFRLMAAALPFVILTAGLRGLMEAYQRFHAVIVVRTISSLAVLIAPLLVLAFTNDLVAVVGAVCLVRLASCAGHAWYCLAAIPGLRQGVEVRADLARPLLGFGGWMTAVNVVNPIMVQMDRFLVGAIVSTAAVAYYTTPFELVTKAWFLSGAVLGVMFPAFATSYARDRARTALIFERCLKAVALILFPVALASVALGHEILTLWLGADFASQSTRVLQWLALGVLLNGVAQVPSALIQGVGRPDLTLKLHLIELPPYLVLAYWLIATRGIEGAAIAWSARTALDLVLYFYAASRLLPNTRPALGRAVVGLLWAVAALAVAALPLGLPYRASALFVIACGFALGAWRFMLSSDDRRNLLARLAEFARFPTSPVPSNARPLP